MAQILQTPAVIEKSSRLEVQILRLLEKGPLSIEELTAESEGSQSETISSISNLIRKGRARLLISQYPWGIEFSVQHVGWFTA